MESKRKASCSLFVAVSLAVNPIDGVDHLALDVGESPGDSLHRLA